MRYILADDQEDIWDTRQTMASHPELQLSRYFLRVPGYGSLWHPGRGWIALASLNGGIRVSYVLRLLRAGSHSEVPYYCSLHNCREEEKAEYVKSLAIKKALEIMGTLGMEENSNANKEGSDSNSYLGRILGSLLDNFEALLHQRCSETKLSEEVYPMPRTTLFKYYLQMEGSKSVDLSKELHLLARIEHALSKMRSELSAMLYIMPSFPSLILYERPSTEILGLLSELEQLVLQRAKRWSSVARARSLPRVWMREIWNRSVIIGEVLWHEEFSQRILTELSKSVAVLFINEAIFCGWKTNQERKAHVEQLSSPLFAARTVVRLRRYDVDAATTEGDRLRKEFLERAELKPPQVLRMIDCIATRNEGRVVLMDWKDCLQAWGYSAISHTYGQDVYKVFDCTCASICKAASKPRCSFDTCPHDPAASKAAYTTQTRVVKDIINMCGTLCDAGVHYAWHDGVCIAQHDEDEVRDTIQHIGWVYSSGRETIIFLHYVGEPMAPVRVTYSPDKMGCRWHTRVWTLQEAALSRRRRYCIRVGKNAIDEWDVKSPVDIVNNVGLWYEDESSSVEVVEEERFYGILKALRLILLTPGADWENQNPFITSMLLRWSNCIDEILETVQSTCFSFPTADDALRLCEARDSKHRGDRMNSILALTGVKDFVAPKDRNVEVSTLEFFEKQGQKGLARALFGINSLNYTARLDNPRGHESRRYTWLPELGRGTALFKYMDDLERGMRLTVLGNGRLEVRAGDGYELLCSKARIVAKLSAANIDMLAGGVMGAKEQASAVEALGDILQSHITKANGHSDTVLEMNLDARQSVVCLPQAPSYLLGFIYTTLMEAEPITGAGRLLNPSHINHASDHCYLEDEESFDVYLLASSNGNSSSFLVLHGYDILRGEVSKIGIFDVFYSSVLKVFKEFMAASSLKLEKVVIT